MNDITSAFLDWQKILYVQHLTCNAVLLENKASKPILKNYQLKVCKLVILKFI